MRNNMRKLVLLLFVYFITLPANSNDSNSKDKYRAAFLKQANVTFKQTLASDGRFGKPGEAEFNKTLDELTKGMTSCHMKSMEYFSPELQEIAYKAVINGGTYADARMSFDTELGAIAAGGGEKKNKVKSMVNNSIEAGQACTTEVIGILNRKIPNK